MTEIMLCDIPAPDLELRCKGARIKSGISIDSAEHPEPSTFLAHDCLIVRTELLPPRYQSFVDSRASIKKGEGASSRSDHRLGILRSESETKSSLTDGPSHLCSGTAFTSSIRIAQYLVIPAKLHGCILLSYVRPSLGL